jgi:predicted nucleic acid-binding protein
MRDKILIDTSAWIAYFQRGVSPNTAEGVDQLLSRSDIFVPKIVLAELIQGAHSEKELSVIREFLGAFHVIGEGEDTWIEAGKLSYDYRPLFYGEPH